MTLCWFIKNKTNLNYKCLIDRSRKSARIILRYLSSHYILDPPIVLKDSTSRYEFSCEQIWPHFENIQGKWWKLKKMKTRARGHQTCTSFHYHRKTWVLTTFQYTCFTIWPIKPHLSIGIQARWPRPWPFLWHWSW